MLVSMHLPFSIAHMLAPAPVYHTLVSRHTPDNYTVVDTSSTLYRALVPRTKVGSMEVGDVLTNMTCYQVEFVFWLVQHLAGLPQEVQVACAMEAILSHGVLLIQLIGQGIHVSVSRHTLVECCVKDCDLQPA